MLLVFKSGFCDIRDLKNTVYLSMFFPTCTRYVQRGWREIIRRSGKKKKIPLLLCACSVFLMLKRASLHYLHECTHHTRGQQKSPQAPAAPSLS